MQRTYPSSLRGKIEHCLEHFPETRNSDITLTTRIWREFYGHKLIDNHDGTLVAIDALYELPREDNVKRYRAKLQNQENKWLPTKWEIAKQRKINEDIWREAMGYNQVWGENGQLNL